jgi:alanyl-tRNA synthetase
MCSAASCAAPSATATSWAQKAPFFHKLVPDLVKLMGDAYPSLARQAQRITEVLKAEEERFYETLANGMEILDAALAGGEKVLPGEVAFKLHDTYGFPLDLTNDVCRERGVVSTRPVFTPRWKQKAQARAAGKFKMDKALEYTGAGNTFVGYDAPARRRPRWWRSTSKAPRWPS